MITPPEIVVPLENTLSESTTSFDSESSVDLVPNARVQRRVTFRMDEKSSDGLSRSRSTNTSTTYSPTSQNLSAPASHNIILQDGGYVRPQRVRGVSEFGERVHWTRTPFERSASSPGFDLPTENEVIVHSTILLDGSSTPTSPRSQRATRSPMMGLRHVLSRKSRTSSSRGESDLISPLTTDDDSGSHNHTTIHPYPSPSSTSSDLPLTPDSASTQSFISQPSTTPVRRPSLGSRVSSRKCAAGLALLLPGSTKPPTVRRPPLRTTYTYTYTEPEYDEDSQGEEGGTSSRGRPHRSQSAGGWRISSDPLPSFPIAGHPPRSLSRSKPPTEAESQRSPRSSSSPKTKSQPPVIVPPNQRRSSRPQSMPPPQPNKPPDVDIDEKPEANVKEIVPVAMSDSEPCSVTKQSRLKRAAKRFSLH